MQSRVSSYSILFAFSFGFKFSVRVVPLHSLPDRLFCEPQMEASGGLPVPAPEEKVAGDVGLKELSSRLEAFAKERDWEKYHSPRNLLLAMIAEVGELSEIFMWRGEVPKGLAGWEEADKEHLGEELSDVLLYLVRLSDICGIDLGDAAIKKITKNAVKYPPPPAAGTAGAQPPPS